MPVIANGNSIKTVEWNEEQKKELEKLFYNMLRLFGYEPELDQNLKKTPARIAKMYVDELLRGCYTAEPDMTIFKNEKKIDSMVVLGPIRVNSLCSHHFVPFIGHAYIGYIPSEKITGISKLARVVDWYARRPQIQEELTEQIANHLQNKLQPQGCGVYITAQHGCMQIRGIMEPNAWMTTMTLKGNFLKQDVKDEFLSYLK